MGVKVVDVRYADRPKTDPGKRVFRIADHVAADAEKLRPGRMYAGDEFRAVVTTLVPGQAQKSHMQPSTDHAWHITSGTGEVEMEDGKRGIVEAGYCTAGPIRPPYNFMPEPCMEMVRGHARRWRVLRGKYARPAA